MPHYGRHEHPNLHPKGGGKGSASRGGPYNASRWRKRRRQHLRSHPLCELCWTERGVVTVAEIVHHVEDHRGDVAAFWFGELQSLCREHHETIHGRGNRVQIGEDGWPIEQQEPQLWPTTKTNSAAPAIGSTQQQKTTITKPSTPQ